MIVNRPVAGFRNWRPGKDGKLFPVNYPVTVKAPPSYFAWNEPKPEAQCSECDSCPGFECHCGFNALAAVTPCAGGDIHGAMVAWGRIVIGEKGFRAQYARPIALLEHGDYPAGWDGRGTREQQIAAVAERFNLPTLPREELALYAAWHGDLLLHPALAAGKRFWSTEAEASRAAFREAGNS